MSLTDEIRKFIRKTSMFVVVEEEQYGIDIEFAHERAKELIPEEFFWSQGDDLSPFGSDEGYTALAEFRTWRKENPTLPTLECLIWTITEIGEMKFSEYNRHLLNRDKVQNQLRDQDFDHHKYLYTLDISVIATGFAQLVDEGCIDQANKEIIKIAIDRQVLCAELSPEWEHAHEYLENLGVLDRALNQV